MAKTISIFACDPQPIVLEGLQKVLQGSGRFVLEGSCYSQSSAMAGIMALKPQLVLASDASGMKSTVQMASEIRIFSPGTRVILWVSEMSEVDCLHALQMGISGVVRKTMPISVLLDCLESVAGGQVWMEHPIGGGASEIQGRRNALRLTPREHDILNLICKGLKNKEIASLLAITAGTVKVHLMHIFEKTGVKDRFQLAVQSRQILASAEPAPEPFNAGVIPALPATEQTELAQLAGAVGKTD